MKSVKIFWAILKKNIKLLLRSKSSAVIILLGPLIVVTLVGVAFSNSQNQFALSVGVYSDRYSNLTVSLVQKLAQKFSVYQFESVVDCVKYVRRGRVNVCVQFPPDLDIKKEGESNEIVFYLDFSRVNIAWIVLDAMTEKVSEKSSQISTDLTQILLTKLSEVQNESSNDAVIVASAVSRQGNISAKLVQIYSDLASVDLSMKADDFRLSEIKSSAARMNNISQQILYECFSMMADVDEKINDMNCSSSKSPVMNRMDRAQKNLSENAELLNFTYGVSEEENETVENSFSYYLEILSGTINRTEKQIGSVAGVKEKISSDSYIKKALVEQSADFSKLNSSVNEIYDKITSIEIKDASTIVNPITTRIQPVTMEDTYFNFLLPTLVVLIVMITSILLSSTIVTNEKKSPSFFRNNIAPVGQFLFNLGTYVTSFLVILLQLAVFVAVALVFIRASMLSSIPTTLMSLMLIISIFVLIGMCIGYFFRSEETTTLAAISISALLLFFSNTVLPIESMPSYVGIIAQYNPFVLSESLLKQSIVFHAPILAFANGMIFLFGGCILLLLILIWLVIRSRKQTFYKHKAKYNG